MERNFYPFVPESTAPFQNGLERTRMDKFLLHHTEHRVNIKQNVFFRMIIFFWQSNLISAEKNDFPRIILHKFIVSSKKSNLNH